MRFQRRQLLRILSFAFGSNFILSRNQLGIAAQTAIQPMISPPPAGTAVRHGFAGGTEMEKVTGIGARSNCGNLQDQALHARLLNSSGLFLDLSWVTDNSDVTL